MFVENLFNPAMKEINLMSDTVTKPTKAMLDAMFSAEVGDDVFGEDATINKLEAKVAAMFGHEAALYCPSGTMTNQIAIKVNTQPLDEILCDKTGHIYWNEVGGYAFHSQVSIRLLDGVDGIISKKNVLENVNPNYDWMANTKMLCIENTANKAGGNFYNLQQMQELRDVCKANNLVYHLDGARIFNALVEGNMQAHEVGPLFDSISVCFSKGLGAPVGSALIGSTNMIKRARKIRKVMGGGMRQAGYLAAACIYALDNNVERLKQDHNLAKVLENTLRACKYVETIYPVKTNIVIAKIVDAIPVENLLAYLMEHHIKAVPFGGNTIRLVTHLDVTELDIEKVRTVLQEFK
jgi:threonine aldolase